MFGLKNYRFKSLPQNEVLKLPIMTPSGFNIGTILMMYRRRNGLRYFGEPVVVRSAWMKPSIKKEPLDSPGWTRAVMMMTVRLIPGVPKSDGSVIVNNGT